MLSGDIDPEGEGGIVKGQLSEGGRKRRRKREVLLSSLQQRRLKVYYVVFGDEIFNQRREIFVD